MTPVLVVRKMGKRWQVAFANADRTVGPPAFAAMRRGRATAWAQKRAVNLKHGPIVSEVRGGGVDVNCPCGHWGSHTSMSYGIERALFHVRGMV
jgi:hypothetical protein